MKTSLLCLAACMGFLLFSCSDDATTQPNDTNSNMPTGQTTTLSAGTLIAENNTPTVGMVSIIRDTRNSEFVSLGSNFRSDFHTGTVTIYLAKEPTNIDMQQAASASNVMKVGLVNMNGAQTFKLPAAASGFNYVVFYCATAKINFGHAALLGQTTTLRMGTLVHQDGPATQGTLAIIRDAAGKEFVQFNSDFMSDFASGTVTVYLAKGNGNIKDQPEADKLKVGLVSQNGMQALMIPGASSGYNYVVLYCSTVQINFGAAELM